ncbi:hypothetical protein FDH66_gp10 [Arthrobacter phage Amigo]|uniref:Uncharacterized protein n=5 Tax=Amigovirus amigo TaxID=1982100 RepID=A0A5J6TBX7_9CAUD|nr:hypothetical protein FDH66_gp10 [Arthrobacter phage Amigo]QFG08310.1 hypothetical protein SEA_YEEZUS_11 [Arthrobacter phage Yeezus]QFG13358.1 hypothetical protein SEA_ICHOR_11 [Arthrobacter phage Ichor]QFG13876.1 hypothetical protein SEA_JAEK_11 [Arthrobacter phage Jaek]QJD51662.1 hypothetical protein SEA_BOERSMA_11 [Arthrobacter phage Boersma]ALY08374.1 hypothetical protein AMIGO_10 [Arthrobacter phage Amigo]
MYCSTSELDGTRRVCKTRGKKSPNKGENMGDVIDLSAARITRALETLQERRTADWARSGRMGDSRAYAERELLLSQLIGLRSTYNQYGYLPMFAEFFLQTIEVNLGLRSKAVWPNG